MIEPEKPGPSIVRQCELLAISRSFFYYQPLGENAEGLALMRLMDDAYMECPYYDARQMRRHLQRLGHKVGRHPIAWPVRKMGLAVIYRKPNTSKPNKAHMVCPYLIRTWP